MIQKVSITGDGVASLVVSTVPCALVRLQGYFKGAADKWLQIHDAMALPADGAVPVRSFVLNATSQFHWAYEIAKLDLATGCVIAVSDTEATLTISASKMNLEVDAQERSGMPSDYSVGGDLINGADSLVVWNAAAGKKSLFWVDVVNNNNADVYLMLFAADAVPANATKPFRSWKIGNGVTKALNFGNSGLSLANCTLALSSTAESLTVTELVASYIRAFYK